METRAFRIKLKPNALERVKEWATELNRRKDEAVETMRDETVFLEYFFLEEAVDGYYLIAMMTAENFEQSQKAAQASLHNIDAYHQQFKKDAWESGEALKPMLILDRLGDLNT